MAKAYLKRAVVLSAMAVSAVTLGGCETTFDLVGVAVPLSAGAAHRYDGSYQGKVNLVSHTGPGCPASEGERVVMIGDGVLWYAYSPSTLFAVPVGYDGSVNGRAGDTAMAGKIDGDHMTLTVKSATCQARMSMDYIYDHS